MAEKDHTCQSPPVHVNQTRRKQRIAAGGERSRHDLTFLGCVTSSSIFLLLACVRTSHSSTPRLSAALPSRHDRIPFHIPCPSIIRDVSGLRVGKCSFGQAASNAISIQQEDWAFAKDNHARPDFDARARPCLSVSVETIESPRRSVPGTPPSIDDFSSQADLAHGIKGWAPYRHS